MLSYSKKGVILFLVIVVLIMVSILATVILRIVSSQARLSHHQVSRIQAQYAAKAALIYTLDKLRRNDASWSATTPATPVTKSMCRSGCDINEPDLHSSIQSINITIYDPLDPHPEHQGTSGTRKITATVDYTYTP